MTAQNTCTLCSNTKKSKERRSPQANCETEKALQMDQAPNDRAGIPIYPRPILDKRDDAAARTHWEPGALPLIRPDMHNAAMQDPE